MKVAITGKGGVGLQMATGYTVAFLVYQVGTLLATGAVGTGFLPGAMAVAVFGVVVVRLCRKADREAAVK